MEHLRDSGNRRHFDTGAVRDISSGKGRCDLMPLIEVSELIAHIAKMDSLDDALRFYAVHILSSVGKYIEFGDTGFLYEAIHTFIKMHYGEANSKGYDALLDLSLHYEAGAMKYSERNWEKGMPLHCFIDSGIRHFLKYCRGDKDEPHNRAFIWNLLGAAYTQKHHPDLCDLPFSSNSPESKK